MAPRVSLPWTLCLLLLPALPAPAAAEPAGDGAAPTRREESVSAPREDATGPPAEALRGRDIYQCVLDNRFDSYVQTSALRSGDRAGAVQESRLRMTWKSFRGSKYPGVLSKSLVKYTHPFDLRFSGYLIVNNEGRPNDQFVYLASNRRIRRVNLRREAVFGTDLTFEDIVPREIEDGDYERKADGIVQELPVYVVEVKPRPHAESEYSRFEIHVEKQRCVPLLTHYWDEKGERIKELTVPAGAISDLGGIHWPMELTMRNISLDSFTTLRVENLDPNPRLSRGTFDLRRLESH